MPDDDAKTDDELAEEEAEAQADGAETAAGGGWSRKRLLVLGGVTLGSFLLSGLIALSLGGHFRRRPLSGLRGVPLLGLLVPAPEVVKAPDAGVPTVAASQPMAATEISELIRELQAARETAKARQGELATQEERLKAIEADLTRERDLLDTLMAKIAKQQTAMDEARTAFEANRTVVEAEERKRVTQLAKIYEAQEAGTAAKELAELDKTSTEGLAVKILASMTEKKAAPIFDAMEPKTAAALKTRLLKVRFAMKKEETS